MASPDGLRQDLAAAMAARSELDPEFESAVMDSLADRVAQEIDARVERQLAARAGPRHDLTTIVVALGSMCLALGVPSATVQLGTAASSMISLVAWVAIVAINVVHARSRRGRR